jgi:hypothetical protein
LEEILRLDLFFVDFAAMTNLDDQHSEPVILDAAKHPIIPYAIAPQTREFMVQGFTEVARICGCDDTFVKVTKDAALN